MRASSKLSLWIIFFLLLIFIIGLFNNKNSEFVNPLIKSNLKETVEQSFKNTQGRYGIYIKNLKTGESFKLNENQKFEPGSLYKLKLMVLTFEQIQAGRLSEDDSLPADVKELNRIFKIASEEAELTEGVIEFSIKSALEQMITISHNYAALALTQKTKSDNLNLPITPNEVGSFFEDLYNGRIIDGDYSAKMMELLSRQKINDRIPKLLPPGVKAAHKTADFGLFEHDGGIVFSEKGDYIFVVLTESKSPQDADEKISQISKAVFEYFKRD